MDPLRVEQNLEMRLVAESDAQEICAVVMKNFEHLHEWMQWAVSGYNIELTRAFISLSLKQFEKGETMNLLIIRDERIAGGIGLNVIDYVNRGTELGYWLDNELTGKGIVSKCCRALIDHAFGTMALHRVVIRCASGNTKSRGIPERLGFRKEGTMRDAELLHGRYVDLVVYSMLEREWRAIRSKQ